MHAGLPNDLQSQLRCILKQKVDVFKVELSSGLTADLPPLTFDKDSTARLVFIKLHSNSSDQRPFL